MLLQILAQESDSGGGSIVGLLPLLALPVIFYFLLIRPQRRRAKEQQQLLSAIDEGDEVMTTAGVYGFVTAIEDDVVWLEIAEGVDIRIARGAIARRVTPIAPEAPAAPPVQDASDPTAPAGTDDDSGTATKP